MRTIVFGCAVLATSCALPSPVLGAEDQSVAEIRQVQMDQADAWNQHDAKAYAALFTADGDVVNVVGWWWRGRDEIERQLTAAFAGVFKESKLTITDVQARFLTADIAVAHVTWTLQGAKMPSQMPTPRQGIQLQVLRREGGTWLIDAFQNTNSMPERPFPAPADVPAK